MEFIFKEFKNYQIFLKWITILLFSEKSINFFFFCEIDSWDYFIC
jgi:hypothetical protein